MVSILPRGQISDEGLFPLFGKFPKVIFDSLKVCGAAVIVLPRFAKNGQQISFSQTPYTFTRQILSANNAVNKRLVRNVHSIAGERYFFDLLFIGIRRLLFRGQFSLGVCYD